VLARYDFSKASYNKEAFYIFGFSKEILTRLFKPMASLIYLYAITDSPVALQGTRVFTHDKLHALVREVRDEEYGETALRQHLARIEWVESAVRHHDEVISELTARATVIPVKFPTLFHNDASLKNFLSANESTFRVLLERLVGKEEWGLKVYASPSSLDSVASAHNEITQLDAEIAAAPAGKAYMLKKKRESLVSSLSSSSLTGITEQIMTELQSVTVAAKTNPVLSKTVTEREDEMILNAAFLVERSRSAAFLAAVDTLQKKFPSLLLDASGAWAAYNFCALPSRQPS
jgi:hypothetical protein